jgi:transposase InsO family protein
VFSAEGVRVIRTPVRAPKANAVAERFVGSVRRECLDWLLIANRRHLNRVLREFAEHYTAIGRTARSASNPNPARQHGPSRPRQPARYADATGSAASSTSTPSPPKTVPRLNLRTPHVYECA